MKKLSCVLAVLLFLASTLFTGCNTEESTGNMKKMVLNEVAHSIFYAPMYVAIEHGYFTDEGIEIELVTGFGADKTMTAVLTGEADIGFMGSESSIYTYLAGVEDYVVNFAQLTQRAGNFVVAREEIENFTWDMILEETVLAGRAGGMPQMVFEYILKKNGINPFVDINMDQSIDFGLTAAAFASGQGSFTIEFEPYATALEEMGEGYVVASLGEESGYVPYTAFCAKQSYIDENSEYIQGFTNALQKGMDYVNTHTAEEIADAIKPQFEEVEMETLITIIRRYGEQDTWKEDLIFHQDAFELLQNILEEAQVIQERGDYEALVTKEFAENAKDIDK